MATIPSLLSITAALIASAHAQATNLISLEFQGTMTSQQQQTFRDAAGYWNSVITGYDLVHDGDGNLTNHSLTITASISTGDGLGGVLGSAGPLTGTYYDNDPNSEYPSSALIYATTGIMNFDTDDVSMLVSDNSFYGVVLHEMAHVLGIGSLWSYNSNFNNTNYPLYETPGQYTGPNALAAWRTEFGQPTAMYVPVELSGGSGTAENHWDEVDGGFFDTGITSSLTGMDLSHELMTGWSSDRYFVSTMTLGALDDLGYIVDYSKAGLVTYVPEPSVCLLGLAALPLIWRKRRG